VVSGSDASDVSDWSDLSESLRGNGLTLPPRPGWRDRYAPLSGGVAYAQPPATLGKPSGLASQFPIPSSQFPTTNHKPQTTPPATSH